MASIALVTDLVQLNNYDCDCNCDLASEGFTLHLSTQACSQFQIVQRIAGFYLGVCLECLDKMALGHPTLWIAGLTFARTQDV